MFWICAKTSVDNSDVFIIAEHCLHKCKAFSASHTTPSVSRLGMHKKLGGDTAGTADII